MQPPLPNQHDRHGVTTAYIGLGSNVDEPLKQVRRAADALDRLPKTRLTAQSSLYYSAPMGYAAQPEFVNAVAAVETDLGADSLLESLQALESAQGRTRSFPNAPRTLDLDLLLYGALEINRPGLIVPHPRMHERAFVLKPLLEIAPDITIPGIGAAKARLAACEGQAIRKVV